MICPHCKTECKSIIYAGTNFTGYNINPNKREKPPLGPVKNFDADQPAVQADERQAEDVACVTNEEIDAIHRRFALGEGKEFYRRWRYALDSFLHLRLTQPAPAAPLTVTDEDVDAALIDNFMTPTVVNRIHMRRALETYEANKGNLNKVTKQEVELAVQDYCLGSPDNREAMRHALEAFIARKGNPK